MDDVFTTEVEKRHHEMLIDLESISVDNIKGEGVILSFGGKSFKFKDLEVIENESIEDRLRKEFKTKLNDQQQKIRDKINAKINQLLQMHQQKQQELDRKEEIMKKKYSQAAMMPDINEVHLMKGLTVVKGGSNDELTWVYRSVYNPRFLVFYDRTSYTRENKKYRKPIPSRLVNKMKQNILLLIKTKGKQVLSVSTKTLSSTNNRSLPNFSHYHQTGNGDCWGQWRFNKEWDTPDDILKIANEAEGVLETINHGSIASRNPTGLPRITTLLNAVQDVNEVAPSTVELPEGSTEIDDVWQSI